jgi:plastocyanin
MTRLIYITFALSILACGGGDDDGGDDPPATDAPAIDAPGIDAPPGTGATVVDCAGVTPIAEIRYNGDVLSARALTVARGDVVRFHSLGSHTAWHDQGLWSATGDESQCVRFDGAGSYGFYCYFHPGGAEETGTITVP